MKTLTEAIEILEEYLHFSHNVDPLYNYQIGVSRIHHSEKEHYWQLVQCKKEEINNKEIEPNIGGDFIVDKQDGNIYMIGSSPLYDWEKEFTKFKLQVNSQINWKIFKNEYLDCQLSIENQKLHHSDYIKCHINERENKIESFINTKFEEGHEICLIVFKPFEKDFGQVEVRNPVNLNDAEICVVSKTFIGPLVNSSNILNQLKKYLRVNNLKLTDNYWIEISKSQINKNYIDWEFEYKMEYKE